MHFVNIVSQILTFCKLEGSQTSLALGSQAMTCSKIPSTVNKAKNKHFWYFVKGKANLWIVETYKVLTGKYDPEISNFITLREDSYTNIYIFIAIAIDETSILVALHFSMQNIYWSCDIGHVVGRSNVKSASNVLCLLTFLWRRSRIALTLSAGVPPLGCSETSVK